MDRLTDPEEKVRHVAVTAICDAAVADLQVRSARRERPPAAPGSAREPEAFTPAWAIACGTARAQRHDACYKMLQR